MKLAGKPLVQHVVEAVQSIKPPPHFLIATSTDPANNALVKLCDQKGWKSFRGDENNVARRFYDALQKNPAEYFVRISADSPWLDPKTLQEAISLALKEKPDLVSTVDTEFPSGTNVEVVRVEAFNQALCHFSKPEHLEHVTPYFYENSSKYSILKLSPPPGIDRRCKFTIDTPKEFERFSELFQMMNRPHYEYSLKDKFSLYEKNKC